MKNKRILMMLAILSLVVLVGLMQQFNQSQSKDMQQEVKVAKVGVLQFVTHQALDEIYRGIKDGLADAGYSGNNVAIEFLNAEGDQSKVQTMSQTLVEHRNQVLIGIATPSAQGLANATSDIPIVMGAVTDPVGANLVKDLTAPDANITGVSDKTPIKEQIELMQTITPNVKKIGVLSSTNEDNSKAQVAEFKQLAEKAGLVVEEYTVPSTNEIATTMGIMLEKVDAVWLPLDNTIASAFATVVQAAREAKKAIYPSVDTMVAEGGLASVVINQYELGVATGKVAAKLLAGQQVAQLPVQVFDKGLPVVNKKVAKELGIELPSKVLDIAEQIIE